MYICIDLYIQNVLKSLWHIYYLYNFVATYLIKFLNLSRVKVFIFMKWAHICIIYYIISICVYIYATYIWSIYKVAYPQEHIVNDPVFFAIVRLKKQ